MLGHRHVPKHNPVTHSLGYVGTQRRRALALVERWSYKSGVVSSTLILDVFFR